MTSRFPWLWQELDDGLLFHGSGATPKGGKDAYQATGIPLVRSMNVYDLRFEPNNLAYIDEIQAQELDRVSITRGDILLNITGASVARCCIAPEQVVGGRVNQHVMILRVDPEKVESAWLGRALAGPYKSNVLAIAGSGATREALTKADVAGFCVSLPPIEIQRQTVNLLQPFDDLIENNRRRIEVAEDMARLLYREWFVHFRFPGHQDVELVDSDLGPIPEGWEVSRVCDAFETVGGGTPRKTVGEYWADGDVQWFTPTDLTRAGSAFVFDSGLRITELGLKKSSAKLFPADSVMMTSRATIGTISISTTEATTNQGFITCVPSERLFSSYIYFWLNANVELFLSLAGGATFKELRKSTFRELLILVPSEEEMNRFEENVGPMMTLIKNLLRQNQVLLEARDLLLPRLVSGELDVSVLGLELEATGV